MWQRSAGMPSILQCLTCYAVNTHCKLHIRNVVLAAGRYHLYIAYACPWASRCLAVRNLKASRYNCSCPFQATVLYHVNITVVHMFCLHIQRFCCYSALQIQLMHTSLPNYRLLVSKKFCLSVSCPLHCAGSAGCNRPVCHTFHMAANKAWQ